MMIEAARSQTVASQNDENSEPEESFVPTQKPFWPQITRIRTT